MDERKPIFQTDEDIQAKLQKKLGPEFVSKRIGFGKNKVAYVEGWKVINLANQIFGYNGWSTDVKSVTVDFLDERQGRFSIGCSAIICVSLANGSYREDVGYGTAENERRKGVAFENAKKTAVTDALKRAMRCYGNALGNCFYDKDFLNQIDKMKYDPPDIEEANLYRASDERINRSRTNTKDYQEDAAELPNKKRQLAKIESPDEIAQSVNEAPIAQSISARTTLPVNPSGPPYKVPKQLNNKLDLENEDLLDDSFTMSDDFQDDDLLNMSSLAAKAKALPVQATSTKPKNDNIDAVVGFVTAKGAVSLQNNKDVLPKENMFDPKYQAHSIKHTIDQSTSKHVPVNAVAQNKAPGSRDAFYEKFAAKGKQLGTEQSGAPSTIPSTTFSEVAVTTSDISSTTSSTNDKINLQSGPGKAPTVNESLPENSIHTEINVSKFAPPSKVVHPNTSVPPNPVRSIRREVGRPKVNPLQLKRTNP
ncbi:DNA repair protein rad52 [Maudiozyma exigua]|uniref:DNA repair and recombination protein RAD52 n=1 Tax=Maudiozyma exigua TaxID=34358 RepID=A0A9P6WCJ1_MAUEX|nr:DNA repair protein rad52 [Kazachstania exigua]